MTHFGWGGGCLIDVLLVDDPWVTSLAPSAMGGLLTFPSGVITERAVIVTGMAGDGGWTWA